MGSNQNQLESSAVGTGQAGDIRINAQGGSIQLSSVEILSESASNSTDDFAEIELTASQGSIFLENSIISATNSNTGFAGEIILDARDTIRISDSNVEADGNLGGIFIGNLITPSQVTITNSSSLSTTNSSVTGENLQDIQIDANAGGVFVDASDTISLF